MIKYGIYVLLVFVSFLKLHGQDTITNPKVNSNGELIREIKNFGDKKIIIDYYSNGKQKSICPYFKDKINGLYISYYCNGNIKSEVAFNQGSKEGVTRFYYSNGILQSYIEYKDNAYNGRFIIYNRKGELISSFLYLNGEKVEE